MTTDLRAARTLTQKDLDDAPVGTVVRAADGTFAMREDHRWGFTFSDGGAIPWQAMRAPAVVLWEAIEHERKPRCYIAGPIAGVPDFRARFAAAVPVVEALGYEPVNPCDIQPAAHDGDCPPGYSPGEEGEHTSSACFMRADLRALLDCDAIYLLPGWRESRGATTEHAVAVACGIPVLEEGTSTP